MHIGLNERFGEKDPGRFQVHAEHKEASFPLDILKSGPEFRNIFSQYARFPPYPASCAAGICRNVQKVGQKGQMNWCIELE